MNFCKKAGSVLGTQATIKPSFGQLSAYTALLRRVAWPRLHASTHHTAFLCLYLQACYRPDCQQAWTRLMGGCQLPGPPSRQVRGVAPPAAEVYVVREKSGGH